MPNRVIRGDLIDSDRYLDLGSDTARMLFLHLCLLADDLGCVSLAPGFVGRRCFSTRPTNDAVEKLILELADADLIRIYEAKKARFAFIPRFGQRLQLKRLKHPMPPNELFDDDELAKSAFNKINNLGKNPTDGKRLDNRCADDAHPSESETEYETEEESETSRKQHDTRKTVPEQNAARVLSPGQVSAILRKSGCPRSSPSQPEVIGLSDSGIDADTLIDACGKAARSKPNGFTASYVAGVIRNDKQRAQQVALDTAGAPRKQSADADRRARFGAALHAAATRGGSADPDANA